MMRARDLLQRAAPALPTLELRSLDGVVDLADALSSGGVSALEIMLRGDCALDAIALLAKERPDMLVGAGTVVDVGQLRAARAAGAGFAVSPGFSEPLARAAQEMACCWLPGVATAGEIMRAMHFGLDAFKFFPASIAGGVGALRALAGPFPAACFCPTGGVGAEDFRDYLALDNVLCVGGSWLASAEQIAARDWRGIAERAGRTRADAASTGAAGAAGPAGAVAATASGSR